MDLTVSDIERAKETRKKQKETQKKHKETQRSLI